MGKGERMRQESGLRLFGVTILGDGAGGRGKEEEEEEALVGRKSRSTENMDAGSSTPVVESGVDDHGCLFNGGFIQCSRKKFVHERKRAIRWTEKEHGAFLIGLKMLGKGDWKGISRKFVITRTPSQVASHAQRYFLRQSDYNKKKHPLSFLDLEINDPALAPKIFAPPLSSKGPHEVVEEIYHHPLNSFLQFARTGGVIPCSNMAKTQLFYLQANTPTFITSNVAFDGTKLVGIFSRSKDQLVQPIFLSPQNISNQIFPSVHPSSHTHTTQLHLPLLLQHWKVRSNLELHIAPPQPHDLTKLF